MKNADDMVAELRSHGFTAERCDVGTICSASYEYEVSNSAEMCSIHVSRGEQTAEVVWFDDGYVESIFVVSSDPVFREAVSNAFFMGDKEKRSWE